MVTIHVKDRDGNEHTLTAESGSNFMEVLRDNDMGVEALCGGMCSCATCHVFVAADWNGKFPEIQDDELELVEETESYRESSSRLSCQCTLTDEHDGIHVEIAPEE